jgi:hypothetical protein
MAIIVPKLQDHRTLPPQWGGLKPIAATRINANEADEGGPPPHIAAAIMLREALARTIATYSDELRSNYLHLGSRIDREKRINFWTRFSRLAPTVLIAFARQDTDIERLADVSEILARIGGTAIGEILNELEQPNPRSALLTDTLLRSLRWSPAGTTVDRERTVAVLRRLWLSDEPDVRESAYELAGSLRGGRALLAEARIRESSVDLRERIDEILASLGG